MLITFHSKAYADITLFGEVAVRLLRMMGHSGTIPGALRAEDVPQALETLQRQLATTAPGTDASAGANDQPDDDPPVSIAHRGLPLVKLLQAAARENEPVMWDGK